MPTFQSSRQVAHSPEQMFALVADVEAYPQFVPLCQALKIRRRTTRDTATEILVADMRVGYKAIRETFTSRVTLEKDSLKILVEYIDGPFSHLQNRWVFRPLASPDGGLAKACSVEFYINYEFRNPVLGLLMGTMFDRAFRKFAAAFEARADEVYGRGQNMSRSTAPNT